MAQRENNKGPNKWLVTIIVLAALFFTSIIAAGILLTSTSETQTGTGNVAVIPLEGVILSGSSNNFFAEQVASSEDIKKLIDEAVKNPGVKAIVIKIDSPGGAPVASDEIARAIKDAKQNKTVIAWIRESGASGAYWIASSSDYIIAHPLSITGSIGVNAGYLEFSGLMQKYGVKYQGITGGKYKDLGSPFEELTPENEKLLQTKVDFMHDYFIREVAANRKLSYEKAKSVSTGIFYLGAEAKELGLVDELGGEAEVTAYLEKKIGAKPVFAEYRVKKSLFDLLADVMSDQSFSVGLGIGTAMVNRAEQGKIIA